VWVGETADAGVTATAAQGETSYGAMAIRRMQPAVVRCVGRGLRASRSSPCPQLIKWRRRGELGGMDFAKLIPRGSTAFTPDTLRDLLRQHYAKRQLGELAGAAVEEEDEQDAAPPPLPPSAGELDI
jgi:hypothetical protein